jgi:hypothetical protein
MTKSKKRLSSYLEVKMYQQAGGKMSKQGVQKMKNQ